MNILAVIPAKAGSKRIPLKNLQTVSGKTLLEWAISAAKESTLISRIIVSTEDPEIKKVAMDAGAGIRDRPVELSNDDVSAVDVVVDVLDWIGGSQAPLPDIVVMLLPTSPQRRGVHIDQAIELFRLEEPKSLISVSNFPYRSSQLLEKRGRYVSPVGTLGHLMVSNGAIQITTPERLLKTGSFHAPGTLPFHLEVADIDTPEDLAKVREDWYWK